MDEHEASVPLGLHFLYLVLLLILNTLGDLGN